MKNYVYSSVFREELRNYVKLRESQGLVGNLYVLQKLDGYLITEKVNEKVLSPAIVDGFIAVHRSGRNASTLNHYASCCSGFAKYLRTLGFDAFSPEYIVPSATYAPYIFTQEEMTDIFRVADNLITFGNTERTNLSRLEFSMLLRLLYGCGLRLGEALRLRLSNVNLSDGVLHILNAKGNIDRLVPMDPTLSEILNKYCESALPSRTDNQPLFPGDGDGEYRSKTWVDDRFKEVLQEIGIDPQTLNRPEREICLHCLRHTFAVHSFRKQDLAGVDNYRATPLLSIYLGHHRLTGTEKYLHMTSENSEDIIAVTNEYSKGLFPEVPL